MHLHMFVCIALAAVCWHQCFLNQLTAVFLLAQLELHPPSQADLVEQMLPAHGHDARLSNRQNPDLE